MPAALHPSVVILAAAASSRVLYAIAILGVIVLTAGIALGIWWWRLRQRSEAGSGPSNPRAIAPLRLRTIWASFLSRLPSAVRVAVPTYPHFVVFGNNASGKSALIGRKVDWQGQTSQFVPSYTADPLMQVYLGSRTVVQEFSAIVQDATSRGINEALKRLWRNMDVDQIPTVVVVLQAASLSAASPDQLRSQAQLLRGKINILADACDASPRVRICLTFMDRVRGYSDLARFLHKEQIPLLLEVGTDPRSDLATGLAAYERHLPRALTTQPLTSFEGMLEFLRTADQLLGPTADFVSALVEGSVVSQRPEVQGVYFSTLQNDAQVGSPFEPPPRQRGVVLGSFLTRWLRPLGLRPLHVLLGGLILILGLGVLSTITRRHRAYVDEVSSAADVFEQSVDRALTLQSSGESDVVRRAEQRMRQSLLTMQAAESRFRPLRLLYRPDKRESERRFVEGIRRAYLLPSLERTIRQRARDKILEALVALYATRENTLGALVAAQPTDWANDLAVPRDTLLDYIKYSASPWSEVAVVALPPLPQSELRDMVSDLGPWQRYLSRVQQDIQRPFITHGELQSLQNESARLQEALLHVRRSALLRQMYRNLAEESPLDMLKLFGRDHSVFAPHPWITDSQDSLDPVLKMVRVSSLQVEQASTKSLYQLLRWLNEGSPATAGSPSASDGSAWHFIFPGDGAALDIKARDWLDLLSRSRKRTFSPWGLRGEWDSADEPTSRRTQTVRERCGTPSRRYPNRRPCSRQERLSLGRAEKKESRKKRNEKEQTDHTVRGGARGASLPLWSKEEFTPKLAALLTGNELPAAGLSDIYNRVVYQREVLPLVQELKKALSSHRNLTAEEKIELSRLVQSELSGYSRRYCLALLNYHLGYQINRHSASALHSELLDLIKPGSPFVARLHVVAENATLPGLDEPYLQPLAQCIAEFKPLVELVASKSGPPTRDVQGADKKPAGDGKAQATAPATAAAATAAAASGTGSAATPSAASSSGAASGSPEGLAGYKAAVSKLIEELDRTAGGAGGAAAAAESGAALRAVLSPIGQSALAMHEGKEDSALRKAEQFLDQAGIAGSLRRPFLAPFLAAYHAGADEIERVMASRWRDTMNGQIEPMLARFPFNPGAEREVAPSELDLISERKGPLFNDVRTLYAAAVLEQGGTYGARAGALGTLRLPKDFLPTVNRLARLSRALFSSEGNRQPLQLGLRGVPGPQIADGKNAQAALAYLQVGKAAAYGFNQQASQTPLSIDWWQQGAAVLGIESVVARTGRKHTQTLEVADSAWSLFRLLQRSTLDASGISTWYIHGEAGQDTQAIRFVVHPDPWELFRVRVP
ncbi:MAG: hypothetical protein JNJ46_12935 [Myxococcales bacterium]|nr:hypothetical protein [Myxococcales bacterium]